MGDSNHRSLTCELNDARNRFLAYSGLNSGFSLVKCEFFKGASHLSANTTAALNVKITLYLHPSNFANASAASRSGSR